MKKNKFKTLNSKLLTLNFSLLLMWGVGGGLLFSCSDFNDYNSVPEFSEESAKYTLLENLEKNPNLTDFAMLAEKCGYYKELASQVLTVWAPVNGSFDAEALLKLDSATLLKEFIKNHIAFYGHSLKTGEAERIHTLNGKSFDFTEEAYGEQAVQSLNIPCQNGVLHIINGQQKFYPNMYEYITTTDSIDSLKNYFKRFETKYLDTENSVLGPTVGGRQTYIDSVMVTTNRLFSRLRAKINNEDSAYMALLPTDKAWNEAYKRIKPYYNYIAKTAAQDLTTEATTAPTKYVNIDAKFFADSLTKWAVMSNIFYNTNDYYNRWAIGRPDAQTTDTLLTTTGTYLNNGKEMMIPWVSKETMSNGISYKVDSLAYLRETWAPEIKIRGISSSTRPKLTSATASIVRLEPEEINPALTIAEEDSIDSYVDLVPTGTRSLPDVYFYLTNVLSTKYEIYAIVVPANIKKDYDGDVKPYKFLATLTYCNANGAIATKSLGTAFINDTSKVDRILLGTFTFPVCYKGLGAYYPSLELKSNIKVFNKTDLATYDRELRIAAIILKPVD